MAVEVAGCPEGDERSDTEYHGAQDFIEDIEVVMGETAAVF